MMGRRGLLLGAAVACAALGIGLLAWVWYVKADAGAYQADARAALEVRALYPDSAPAVRREGEPLGEIASARIGLRAVIAEGESDATLRRSVGHVPGTSAPGEDGNVALAGHRDSFFRPLRNIKPGDVIVVTVAGRDTRYAVEWTRVVDPDAIWVIGPGSGRSLTLITCYPFSFIGSAPQRFVVRAREQPDPATPAGDVEG